MKQKKNLSKTPIKDEVKSNEICYHPPKDRVRTHRGFHCNRCGKRF